MTDPIQWGAVRPYRGCMCGLRGPSVCLNLFAPDANAFQPFHFLADWLPSIFFEGQAPFHRPSEHLHVQGLDELAQLSIHAMRCAGVPVRLEYLIKQDVASNELTVSLPALHPQLTVDCFKLFADHISGASDRDREGLQARAFLRKLIAKTAEWSKPHALRRQNPKNIVFAAYALELPVSQVSESFIGIGRGSSFQRFVSSFSDETPVIAVNIARCKRQTNQLLKRCGMPVAKQIFLSENSDPVVVAESLGYPVVVKPSDQDGGRGVHAGILDATTVLECVSDARKYSKNVVMEQFHEGTNYRVTLVRDVLTSANRKFPGGVFGDGVSPVHALIEAQQKSSDSVLNPYEDYKPPLVFDKEAAQLLSAQSLDLETVLPEGAFAAMRRRTNAITGGMTVPMDMDDIHPENLTLFRDAARVIGLDICGVDYISTDISQPWYQAGGIIVELNAQPQMGYGSACQMLQILAAEKQPPMIDLMLYQAGTPIDVEEVRCALSRDGLSIAIWGSQWIGAESIVRRSFRSDIGAILCALQDRRLDNMLCLCSDQELQQWGFPFEAFRRLLIHPSMARSELFSEEALEALSRSYVSEILHFEA